MLPSIQQDVDLSEANSLRLKSIAANYLEIYSAEALQSFLSAANFPFGNKLFILGEGSNVVLPEYFSGLVIRPMIEGIKIIEKNDTSVLLEAGAGENWHNFVEYTIEQGFFGLENLSLIPGSVGASPIQNIGAYGVEVCEFIDSVEVYDFSERKFTRFDSADCEFDYRDSIFKTQAGRYLVLFVRFRLSNIENFNLSYQALSDALEKKQSEDASFLLTQRNLSRLVCAIRSERLPDLRKIANAGSFFKNPIVENETYSALKKSFPGIVAFPQQNGSWKLSAAWLIDSCGWKGKQEAGVGVYARHALVLTSNGNVTQEQLLAFAKKITDDVKGKFLVQLEIEPVLLT